MFHQCGEQLRVLKTADLITASGTGGAVGAAAAVTAAAPPACGGCWHLGVTMDARRHLRLSSQVDRGTHVVMQLARGRGQGAIAIEHGRAAHDRHEQPGSPTHLRRGRRGIQFNPAWSSAILANVGAVPACDAVSPTREAAARKSRCRWSYTKPSPKTSTTKVNMEPPPRHDEDGRESQHRRCSAGLPTAPTLTSGQCRPSASPNWSIPADPKWSITLATRGKPPTPVLIRINGPPNVAWPQQLRYAARVQAEDRPIAGRPRCHRWDQAESLSSNDQRGSSLDCGTDSSNDCVGGDQRGHPGQRESPLAMSDAGVRDDAFTAGDDAVDAAEHAGERRHRQHRRR